MLLTIGMLVANQIEVTRQCVKYLKQNTHDDLKLILVDNGSDLAIQEELKSMCDIYIRNDSNIGVIAAMNQIWPLVETDYVMYIHNDLMILEKDWDLKVKKIISEIDKLGVAGFGGGDGVTRDGLRFNFTSAMINAEDHGKRISAEYIPSVVQDGMCLIVNKRLIEDMGGLALDYTIHHFYDLDTCLEAIYHGYNVATINCVINHMGGQTSVRTDYVEMLAKSGKTDLGIHSSNMDVFNSKWGTKFPITVDSNFNYRDINGDIQIEL